MESMAELQAGALSEGAAILGDARDATPARRIATLTELVPRLVPDSCGATAMLWDGSPEPPLAASHPDLAALVGAQLASDGGGPLRAALESLRPVRMADLLHDDRWPRYRASALASGVRSSVTMPFARDGVAVALSVYRLRPGGLERAVHGPPELLGRMTTDAIARDRRYHQALATVDQLGQALRTRPVVDQACGIVMYVTGCDAAEAFDILKRISQHTNRKLSELAAVIVDARGLPAGSLPG